MNGFEFWFSPNDSVSVFAFHAPAARDRFAPAVGSYDPILRGTISMKDQVFVFRTLENDGRFPPMTD